MWCAYLVIRLLSSLINSVWALVHNFGLAKYFRRHTCLGYGPPFLMTRMDISSWSISFLVILIDISYKLRLNGGRIINSRKQCWLVYSDFRSFSHTILVFLAARKAIISCQILNNLVSCYRLARCSWWKNNLVLSFPKRQNFWIMKMLHLFSLLLFNWI